MVPNNWVPSPNHTTSVPQMATAQPQILPSPSTAIRRSQALSAVKIIEQQEGLQACLFCIFMHTQLHSHTFVAIDYTWLPYSSRSGAFTPFSFVFHSIQRLSNTNNFKIVLSSRYRAHKRSRTSQTGSPLLTPHATRPSYSSCSGAFALISFVFHFI